MSLTKHNSFGPVFSLILFVKLLSFLVNAKQHSVVIIGAGSAGLAAATRLLEHNQINVTVLEAEARIGGRVNSVAFGDAIVELGAEWCHGQAGNVVYDLVKDLNLLEEYDPELDIVFYNGKSLSRNESGELMGMFLEVSHSMDGIEDKNITTGEAFIPAFKEAVESIYSDNAANIELVLKTLPLMEKYILALDSSFSWYSSSAAKTYKECPGNQGLTWKGQGFKQIFDIISDKITKSAGITTLLGSVIQLNKVVSKIEYKTDKVVVTCTDGGQYLADFVVFTPGLGVLKHDHEDLFHPPLPEEKVKAIEDLGIDAVMKIVLHYDHIWWPTDLGGLGYNFVFTEEDEQEIVKLFHDDPVKDGKSWITSIIGFLPVEQNPHVISFWLVGPLIPLIEKMSNDKIMFGISYLLNKALHHRNINVTQPVKMIRSNWYTNPHFRGSYSYETIRSQRQEGQVHLILAEPVKNGEGKEVLFFAGEATNTVHYSTVHGAMESGYREAERILKNIEDTV